MRAAWGRQPLSLCFESVVTGYSNHRQSCSLPIQASFIYEDDPNRFSLALACPMGHQPYFLYVSPELESKLWKIHKEAFEKRI